MEKIHIFYSSVIRSVPSKRRKKRKPPDDRLGKLYKLSKAATAFLVAAAALWKLIPS